MTSPTLAPLALVSPLQSPAALTNGVFLKVSSDEAPRRSANVMGESKVLWAAKFEMSLGHSQSSRTNAVVCVT